MKTICLTVAAATLAAIATSVSAQECVKDVDQTVQFSHNGQTVQAERLFDYTAVIGPRDMTNSSGTRLASFAAIMQQDRANLHKSGIGDSFGDYRETVDSYFTTLERRSFLSRARYYTDCTASLRDLIKALANEQLPIGILWVVLFRHPDGGTAVYISEAG